MESSPISNSSQGMSYSTFYVGKALCGIDVLHIQEINKINEITKVPQSPVYINGIINLRGRIITVIDLGKKLGLTPVQKNNDNRSIIVASENEGIGLLVDAVSNVIHVGEKDLEKAPFNIDGIKRECFKGVLKTEKQLVGILDIDKVLKE